VERLLNKIDEAKQLIDKAKETFELRRAAILDKAFRGELTAKWRNTHNIFSEWEETTLGELIEAGPQNGLYKPKSAYGDGTLIVRIDNFYNGQINEWNTLKRLQLEKKEIELYGLDNNDLIINRVNSIEYLGKSALVRNLEEPCVFESNVMRIKLNQRVIPEYIVLYLNSSKGLQELRKNAKHAVNQASINQQDVKNPLIPLPKIEEQIEIVNILKGLLEREQLSFISINTNNQFNLLKSSILSKAFRGELGTNDPTEESAIELLKEVLQEQLK
jgi:type I restriction enzyme S subunit